MTKSHKTACTAEVEQAKPFKDLVNLLKDPDGYAREITVKKLVSILDKLSKQYYNTGCPFVDDVTYDILIDILKERDPDNAFLFRVGADPANKDAVELPFGMYSLNKIKSGEKSFTKWFSQYDGPYIVSDKLDGISAQLHKNNSGELNLYTRGKATTGRNISHLIPHLINAKIAKALPVDASVRGEIIISRKDFAALADEYKNARNTVAGIVNSNITDSRLIKNLQFVTYSVINPTYVYSEQLKLLKQWGFKVVWNKLLDNDKAATSLDDFVTDMQTTLDTLLKERKASSDFDVDGIVVVDNAESYQNPDENPPFAMAFKANVVQKEATVEKVIWEPTMYGYLQPIIQITPIELMGTTITFVTGHHAKYIKDNKIGKGSVVKIVRSGDVIPYVVGVIKPNTKADMPSIKHEWSETGVDLIAVDPDEDTQRTINIKKNLYFFKAIGVKNFSQGLITKLYDNGYETIFDIVTACRDRTKLKISGMGDKLINKLYDNIDKTFAKVKLYELMTASLKFGRGIGIKKIKEIIDAHPDILTYPRTMDDKEIADVIGCVSGFAETTAEKFVAGIDEFNDFLDELRKAGNYRLEFAKQPKKVSQKLSGHRIVMTGFRDQRIAEFIEANGGKVTNSVSRITDLVLCLNMDNLSGKLEKAIELKIPIMLKDEFVKKFLS